MTVLVEEEGQDIPDANIASESGRDAGRDAAVRRRLALLGDGEETLPLRLAFGAHRPGAQLSDLFAPETGFFSRLAASRYSAATGPRRRSIR